MAWVEETIHLFSSTISSTELALRQQIIIEYWENSQSGAYAKEIGQLIIDNKFIQQSSDTNILGIWFDQNLKWNVHKLSKICYAFGILSS